MADESSTLIVRLSDDRMFVLLDGVVTEESLDEAVDYIEGEMERLAVADKPAPAQLREQLQAVIAGGDCLEALVLVSGQPPVPPKDGRIEWVEDFFTTGFVMDEITGAVNYRERSAHLSVQTNQSLARLIPPVEGVEGRDVLGKRIPAPKAKKPRISAGRSVCFDESTGIFLAEANGRIRWANNVLSVDQILAIEGSVGLETGNIVHPGALVVEQDILAGSHVTSTGDIDVRGVLEAADIESGGNLTVKRGIASDPRHFITVAGNLHAGYILDANVEVGGDIQVDREIVHSTIKGQGAISMPKGRLVGGDVTAFSAVVVGQAGSESIVPTRITVTGNTHALREIMVREKEIAELDERLAQIHAAIDPLISRVGALPPQKQQAIQQLLGKAKELEEGVAQLRDEIDELHAEASARVRPHVIIRDKLFPETTFCISSETFKVEDFMTGPLRVSVAEGRIQFHVPRSG